MSLEGKATAETILRGKINNLDVLTIDAYGVAVRNGFEGTEEEWLASLKGDKGDTEVVYTTYVDFTVAANSYGEVETMTVDGETYDGFVDYTAREMVADATADLEAQIEDSVGALAEEIAQKEQLKPAYANDIAGCTDTTTLYVLPDGYIYAYIGGAWQSTGRQFVPADYEDQIVDLENAVFNIVDVGACPNLFDPKEATVQQVAATITSEAHFSAKIPCVYGDKVYVRQRGENDTATMYTRFWGRIYATNGTVTLAKALSGEALNITIENATHFEVGLPVTEVTEDRLADFMVVINDRPTEFVEYWEGTTKKSSRIDANSEEIQLLKEQTDSLAEELEVLKNRPDPMESVDALNAAVFDVQELGVCPNLLNPEYVEYKKPYDTWTEQYISAKITASTGDLVYVKCRDESKNDVRGLFNKYYVYEYASNGTKTAARNSGVYEPVYTITSANAAYIEIGFPTGGTHNIGEADIPDFMVTLNTEPTEFVEYWEGTTKKVNLIEENGKEIELLKEQMENHPDLAEKNWQGKKVLVIGDSISTDYYANYTKWVTVLKNQGYFPADTKNDSIHGTGFVATYDGDDRFVTRLASVEDKDTYDLVVIFGGINDAISSKPMGEKGGDKTAEFKPAVDYFFEYLVNNFTQARIVVLSPLLTKATGINTAGHRYIEYINYIKEVAKSYCLPILNLTEESGFCPFITAFSTRWTYNNNGAWAAGDGVHPNAEYEEKHLAPMIKSFLNQFI